MYSVIQWLDDGLEEDRAEDREATTDSDTGPDMETVGGTTVPAADGTPVVPAATTATSGTAGGPGGGPGRGGRPRPTPAPVQNHPTS